jgi:chromosome segregation ATPase
MISESLLRTALDVMRSAKATNREAYVDALRKFCQPHETMQAYIEAFVAKAILDDRRKVSEECTRRRAVILAELGDVPREIEELRRHLETLTSARMRSLAYAQRLEEQLLDVNVELTEAKEQLAQVTAALKTERNKPASEASIVVARPVTISVKRRRTTVPT